MIISNYVAAIIPVYLQMQMAMDAPLKNQNIQNLIFSKIYQNIVQKPPQRNDLKRGHCTKKLANVKYI